MVIFLIGSAAALFLFVVLGLDDYGKWSINPRQMGAAMVLAITLGVSMVTLVPTGYTGILTSFGKVEDRTIQAGLNITAPWQKVVKMDNRAQKETIET